jgi:hypothetical protein
MLREELAKLVQDILQLTDGLLAQMALDLDQIGRVDRTVGVLQNIELQVSAILERVIQFQPRVEPMALIIAKG